MVDTIDRSSEDDESIKSLISCLLQKDTVNNDTKQTLTKLLGQKSYNEGIVAYIIAECTQECAQQYLSVQTFPRKFWGYATPTFRQSVYNDLETMKKALQNLTSPKELDGRRLPVYNLLKFFIEIENDKDLVGHLQNLPTDTLRYLPRHILQNVYDLLEVQEKSGQLTNGVEGSQVKYQKVKQLLGIEDSNNTTG